MTLKWPQTHGPCPPSPTQAERAAVPQQGYWGCRGSEVAGSRSLRLCSPVQAVLSARALFWKRLPCPLGRFQIILDRRLDPQLTRWPAEAPKTHVCHVNNGAYIHSESLGWGPKTSFSSARPQGNAAVLLWDLKTHQEASPFSQPGLPSFRVTAPGVTMTFRRHSLSVVQQS